MTISFDVEGIPKAQPRAKASSWGGKARMYDPGTANGWKYMVAAEAKRHRVTPPIDQPIRITLDFRMPRPNGHYTTKGLRPTAPHMHSIRPDADNLAKAVMDALSDCAFWRDDCLIWSLKVEKRYIADGERPGCGITIFFETQP